MAIMRDTIVNPAYMPIHAKNLPATFIFLFDATVEHNAAPAAKIHPPAAPPSDQFEALTIATARIASTIVNPT